MNFSKEFLQACKDLDKATNDLIEAEESFQLANHEYHKEHDKCMRGKLGRAERALSSAAVRCRVTRLAVGELAAKIQRLVDGV